MRNPLCTPTNANEPGPIGRPGLRLPTSLAFLLVSLPASLLALGLLSAVLLPNAAFAAPTVPTAALPESGVAFHGADDTPLPLTENELLDFLRTAPITKVKTLETGINNTRKLTLERDGIRLNAVFRTVDRKLHDTVGATRPNRFGFRDSYLFEVTAYRLSRMLDIHRVPPAVLREIDGESGSVQLWIENSTTAADAIKGGVALRRPALFHQQRQLMYAFDQLVFNFDRHHGNILYDQRDRLWFIDHTRSFKRLDYLTKERKPVLGDRAFYDALSTLDPDAVKDLMAGVLTKIEIDALLRRRTKLLRHFDDLVAEFGSDAVLIDLNRTVKASLDAPDVQMPRSETAPAAVPSIWTDAPSRARVQGPAVLPR